MARRNELLEALEEVLARAGIKLTSIEYTGSGHMKVRWCGPNGRPRTYIVQKSKSCVRAEKNLRCDIRRMLRQDGLPA